MNTKHTPTPWIAEGQQIVAEENGYRVAIVSSPHPRARGKERMEDLEYCQGNTAFIIRACDAHDMLVKALRVIKTQSIGPDWTVEQAAAFMKQHAAETLAALADAESA